MFVFLTYFPVQGCRFPPLPFNGLINQVIEAMTSLCIVRPWKWPLIYGICCNGHVPRWMWAASVGRFLRDIWWQVSHVYIIQMYVYISMYCIYHMILIISESSSLCWWINWETAGDSGAEMMMGVFSLLKFFFSAKNDQNSESDSWYHSKDRYKCVIVLGWILKLTRK